MSRKSKPKAQGWGAAAAFLVPAVFLSAFLIFQVQPMIGKHILPWFGGAPSVWTTCLLFFQTLLLVGYAYAHLSASKLQRRWQVIVHLALLAAALFVSILPGKAWQPQGGEYPLVRITLMLLVSVGLPFVALSASGPLLQSWYAKLRGGRAPYPLYAVSNAGSLLALVSYPFLIEPALSVAEQARVWYWAFVAFIVFCAVVAGLLWKASSVTSTGSEATAGSESGTRNAKRASGGIRRLDQWLWVAWSTCAVVLFMAVTNVLTMNIAAIPLLWILPLSIYLVSFILTFSGKRWYNRKLFAVLLVVSIAVFIFALPTGLTGRDILLNTGVVQKILLAAVALFVCCMVCNGELYRLRPHPSHLTRYYLSIAVGGAIGGIIVAVVAPNLFLVLQELQLGLVLCCLLFLTTVFNDPEGRLRKTRYRWAWAVSVVGVVLMAAWTWFLAAGLLSNTVYTDRDFFGLVRVKELGRVNASTPHRMEMYSGTTLHGLQLLGPELRRMPTAYYGPTTGAGVLLSAYGSPRGRRVGMVGMGVGTLSAYGRPGDVFVYYELNPSVVDIAYEYFSFLEDSPSEHEVRLGDARLNLEREPDQEFDILVLDAFNSDSIPVHLLTIEAMEVYGRHLRQDGVIAIHVTNTFLDLFPLVYNLAEATGFHAIGVVNAPRTEVGTLDSAWALLSRDASVLRGFAETAQPLRSQKVLEFIRPTADVRARVGTWTDDFSNVFELLSLNG